MLYRLKATRILPRLYFFYLVSLRPGAKCDLVMCLNQRLLAPLCNLCVTERLHRTALSLKPEDATQSRPGGTRPPGGTGKKVPPFSQGFTLKQGSARLHLWNRNAGSLRSPVIGQSLPSAAPRGGSEARFRLGSLQLQCDEMLLWDFCQVTPKNGGKQN